MLLRSLLSLASRSQSSAAAAGAGATVGAFFAMASSSAAKAAASPLVNSRCITPCSRRLFSLCSLRALPAAAARSGDHNGGMRSKISRIQSPTPPPFPRSIAASAAAPSSANENSSSTSSSSSPDAEMTPAVLRAQVDDLAKQVESALAVIDLPAARARLAKLEEKASDENLWDDRAAAEELLRSVERCREEVEEGRRLQELLDDAQAAAELAVSCSSSGSGGGSSGNSGGENAAEAATPSENDSDALAFAAEGFSYVSLLRKALDDFELSRLLSGEFDGSDATVSIQAGAGGTEAMDWVSRVFCHFFFYRGRERKERKMSREEKKGVAGEKKTHSLSPSFSPSSLFQRDRKSERREKEREGKRREGREKGEKKRGTSEKVETRSRKQTKKLTYLVSFPPPKTKTPPGRDARAHDRPLRQPQGLLRLGARPFPRGRGRDQARVLRGEDYIFFSCFIFLVIRYSFFSSSSSSLSFFRRCRQGP